MDFFFLFVPREASVLIPHLVFANYVIWKMVYRGEIHPWWTRKTALRDLRSHFVQDWRAITVFGNHAAELYRAYSTLVALCLWYAWRIDDAPLPLTAISLLLPIIWAHNFLPMTALLALGFAFALILVVLHVLAVFALFVIPLEALAKVFLLAKLFQ